MRVLHRRRHLIGEFGEERRAVVNFQDVPDGHETGHPGGRGRTLLPAHRRRRAGRDARRREQLHRRRQAPGRFDDHQQVAKNFFLSSEKTYTRKLYEALLSFKIENNLSKDQIFELYINQIYLGQRAYGFGAAAQIYFGKPLKDISIAEAAMLAGLPKAPSAFNPVVNPKRASLRQQYVLRRMHELGFIDAKQYEAALKQPLIVKRDSNEFAVHAEYVAEMARQIAVERFPQDVYTRGLRVYHDDHSRPTRKRPTAACGAVCLDYDRRHGYRGAEAYVDMADSKSEQDEALDELLQDLSRLRRPAPGHRAARRTPNRSGPTCAAARSSRSAATASSSRRACLTRRRRRTSACGAAPSSACRHDDKNNWRITQMPEVEAAFVVRRSAGRRDPGRWSAVSTSTATSSTT